MMKTTSGMSFATFISTSFTVQRKTVPEIGHVTMVEVTQSPTLTLFTKNSHIIQKNSCHSTFLTGSRMSIQEY